MANRQLIAGVDSSTQSVKVVIRDANTGELVRQGRSSHPDGTEVDPKHWLSALNTAIAEAGDLDDVMARTVRLLAQITKQVAVVQYPSHADTKAKVALAGTANLARSSHEQASDIHPILEALEEQVVLLRLLSDVGDSMRVRIGDEQSEKNLQTTSLVSMSYGQDGSPAGALGIIGPTRMDYASSMSAVTAVARYVGKFLGDNK